MQANNFQRQSIISGNDSIDNMAHTTGVSSVLAVDVLGNVNKQRFTQMLLYSYEWNKRKI